jgi:uncharacterized protein YdaU (DUF1376 family)
MHHYPFHPGDYLLDTVHLDAMHDLAYRRLLDLYYSSEEPIPLETQRVATRLRMETQVVASVLAEFFLQQEDGWHQARCDTEINRYNGMADRNRRNGSRGGRPKKTQRVKSRNPAGCQWVASGLQPEPEPEPEPIKRESARGASGDDIEAIRTAYPRKTHQDAANRAIAASLAKGHDPAVMRQGVRECAAAIYEAETAAMCSIRWVPTPANFFEAESWLEPERFAETLKPKANHATEKRTRPTMSLR